MLNVCEYCKQEIGVSVELCSSVENFINGGEILFMHISDIDVFMNEVESVCSSNLQDLKERVATIKQGKSREYFGIRPTNHDNELLCAYGSIKTYLGSGYESYNKACFIGFMNNKKYELKNGTIVTYVDGMMVNEDGFINRAATMAMSNKNLSQFVVAKRL